MMSSTLTNNEAHGIETPLLLRLTDRVKQAYQLREVEFHTWQTPGGGASSRTVIFAVRGTRCDGTTWPGVRLVLRALATSDAGGSFQREYDLRRQALCMKFVANHGYPRVPHVVIEDFSDGFCFFVMEAVEGVPLEDSHRMFSRGPLAEASADDQRRFYDDCVKSMAALHDLPLPQALRQQLSRPQPGQSALGRELAWLKDTYVWGKGTWPQAEIDRAFAWLESELPADTEEVMLWGDGRPPNMIMKDFQVAACLDWELASIGPGALDVFWFTELNRLKAGRHVLPGFRTEADTVALYESLRGRPIEHLDFYRFFAALRSAVMTLRFMVVSFQRGKMPNGLNIAHFDERSAMLDNPATQRLRRLMADLGV